MVRGDNPCVVAAFSLTFFSIPSAGRNAKETLDKKMIADILTFSWDSAVRNDHTAVKPCVVLLTSDGVRWKTTCSFCLNIHCD